MLIGLCRCLDGLFDTWGVDNTLDHVLPLGSHPCSQIFQS